MGTTMHLQIISRQTIKPSSPTPPHLKIHTLSLFDQIAPHMYVPLVFFFRPDHRSGTLGCGVARSELLRQSLSRTLSRYYPLAGRMKEKEKWAVDCNDEGVSFLEGKVEGLSLGHILANPKTHTLDLLFPDGLQWKDSSPPTAPFLNIQITHFDCGGLAIGVLMSHKLGDMATLVKFVQHWALLTRLGQLINDVNPRFDSAVYFPHGDLPPMTAAVIEQQSDFACKRFVFEDSKIKALKSKICDKIENPTRVEVVTALIYKAIINSTPTTSLFSNSNSNSNSNSILSVMLLQTLNLRTRVVPPLPETTAGSLVSFFPVTAAAAGESELQLHELVGTMRNEMEEFCNKYAKKYRTEEWMEVIKKRLIESKQLLLNNNGKNNGELIKMEGVYRCSSGCRFGIYDVDFGWGAADWVTMAAFKMKNTIMMLDDKNGGGIEAFICLEHNHMAVFQNNPEFLAFASLNPSVSS